MFAAYIFLNWVYSGNCIRNAYKDQALQNLIRPKNVPILTIGSVGNSPGCNCYSGFVNSGKKASTNFKRFRERNKLRIK